MVSRRIRETFAALEHPNYRLWFIGQLLSLVGTWMQSTAQGYLVFDLTKSAAYLGYVSFAAGLPTWLFTLFGGVIADRFPKRNLLVITQAFMMLLAAILAVLTFTGTVQPWHIIALSFFLGIANAFDAPTRQSFVAELVERRNLTNAIALNATMFNTGVVVGPAFAGLIYAWLGPGWCFTLNAISFVAVIIALFLMKISAVPRRAIQSPFKGLSEGLKAVISNKTIIVLLIMLGVSSIFAFGCLTLIPAWAVDVLKGDVRTNGLLLSARGVGSLGAGLLIANIGSKGFRGKIWTVGAISMPICLFIFSLFRSIPISLFFMALVGWTWIMVVNTSNALIQSNVSDELRGRVMGFYTLVMIGGQPLGALLTGLVADRIGEPVTFAICAGILMFVSVFLLTTQPWVRDLK